MSSNEASLLLKIKGDSTGGVKAAADTRAAIASLRTSAATNFSAIQAATKAPITGMQNLTNITQTLSAATSALHGPLGGISSRITALGTLARESAEGLSTTTGAAGQLGSTVAALAGPIGIAVVAIGAMTAATAVLVKGLFNLAERTADFRGKLFDLSLQTGVQVETLNALEIVASKTGGSIDGIAQSLVIFQGHLDDAQDASSKMGKQFRELGISTNNTETAFRDAVRALAAMPVGFHQTNEAAELFGRRGGKQVLAIIKETGGNIDSAVTKLGDLARVTREDAKQADDFNDALRDLTILMRGVGNEAIPPALAALQDLSKVIKDNQSAFDALGFAIGVLSTAFGGEFKRDLQLVNTLWQQAEAPLKIAAELYERIALATGLIKAPPVEFGGTAAAGSGQLDLGGDASVGGGFARKSQKDARKAALDESADIAAKELEIQRKLTAALQFERDKRGIDVENDFKRQKKLVDDHLSTLEKQIAREREINQQALTAGGIDQAEYDGKKRELELRATEAKNKRDEEVRRLTLEKDRALLQAELTLREQASAISENRRKGELARQEALLERGLITEAEYIDKQLAYLKAAHEERQGIITFEMNALVITAERKTALDTEKQISEQKYTDEFKRLTQQRIDILNKEDFDRRNLGAQGASRQRRAGDRERRVNEAPEDFNIPTGAVDQLFLAINNNLTGDTHTAALAGLTAMSEAFSGLGQAVGQAVASFVLYGTVGKSVRQVTAEVLAGIAQMAATKAIFHLAEGFAALAMAFFGIPNAGPSAAMHFKAAAMFGIVAGIAAVAGRAAAGNSFQSSSSGGGSGGGGSSSRDGRASSDPKARDFDRQNFATPQPVDVRISFAEGFDDVLEARILKNVRRPGDLRNEIGNN